MITKTPLTLGGFFCIYYKNQMKRLKITENQLRSLFEELTYNDFKTGDFLQELVNSINKNNIVSVAYVKTDGQVRHIALRKSIKAHQFSNREKSDAEKNLKENNNVINVIEVNVYNKARKAGLPPEEASKKSWRRLKLERVLGFLSGGKFYDTREINRIKEKFGEEIYNQLSGKMLAAEQQEIFAALEDLG